jgi:Prp8 binding protein
MNKLPAPKRRKGDAGEVLINEDSPDGGALVVANASAVEARPRGSSLPSPTLQLTGHSGSVYAVQYSPNGATLCSASFDKTCLLWQHRPMEFMDDDDDHGYPVLVPDVSLTATTPNTVATYDNFGVLKGHKNAVLDCAWCDNQTIVTASADHTVGLWDAATGQRWRKWTGHTGIVNAVTVVDAQLVASASDDRQVLVWDRRTKYPLARLAASDYPVLAVAAQQVGTTQLFTAGIDPQIRIWDLRQLSASMASAENPFQGHSDTVTSLAVHPEGTHLLSNSMDQTLRQWDIRPFVQSSSSWNGTHPYGPQDPRLVRTYAGHAHNAEKGLLKCAWSANGQLVSGGSSDARVHIWDVLSGQELYDLPGHKGCVHAVTFHPTETVVIASGSSDRQIFVGELS